LDDISEDQSDQFLRTANPGSAIGDLRAVKLSGRGAGMAPAKSSRRHRRAVDFE
jgi:hypothetical protein